MHDFIFIIQARTNSTRMPGKMLKNFYQGKTIPEIIVARLTNNFPNIPIIVATTDSVNDDSLVKMLKNKCTIVRGCEDDVLQRFIDVQKHIKSKAVIRVCADNPFIDVSFIKELISNWDSTLDYLSHRVVNKPVIKTGMGMFCELTTFETLKKVSSLTSNPYYLEHVTNYIYEHPDVFKLNWIEVEKVFERPDIRLTVDTLVDFNLTKDIYENLCKFDVKWGSRDVISYIDNGDFLELMNNENQKNGK